MTEATDEDIVQIKRACEYWKLDFRCDEAGEIMVEMLPKLLARLERVEGELAQTEKECENALAALAGEPYPYPEIKLRK